MILSTIFSIIVIVLVLIAMLLAGKKYEGYIEEYKADFQLLFMAPASLYIIDKLQLLKRLSGQLVVLQQRIAMLYSGKNIPQYTKMFMAQIISVILVSLLGGSIFYFLAGKDALLLILALILAAFIPALSIKNIDKKVNKRKQDIIYELPEFANKVALLVNAGETIQEAMIHCTTMKGEDKNPLYIELNEAISKIKNGESFHFVMEEFSKRCGVQEVSIFTTTILLNYRRGGGELALSLRELSGDLWEKRKAISKIRGEEASSKLIFPMILMFMAILLIMAFPALKLLG